MGAPRLVLCELLVQRSRCLQQCFRTQTSQRRKRVSVWPALCAEARPCRRSVLFVRLTRVFDHGIEFVFLQRIPRYSRFCAVILGLYRTSGRKKSNTDGDTYQRLLRIFESGSSGLTVGCRADLRELGAVSSRSVRDRPSANPCHSLP